MDGNYIVFDEKKINKKPFDLLAKDIQVHKKCGYTNECKTQRMLVLYFDNTKRSWGLAAAIYKNVVNISFRLRVKYVFK